MMRKLSANYHFISAAADQSIGSFPVHSVNEMRIKNQTCQMIQIFQTLNAKKRILTNKYTARSSNQADLMPVLPLQS